MYKFNSAVFLLSLLRDRFNYAHPLRKDSAKSERTQVILFLKFVLLLSYFTKYYVTQCLTQ